MDKSIISVIIAISGPVIGFLIWLGRAISKYIITKVNIWDAHVKDCEGKNAVAITKWKVEMEAKITGVEKSQAKAEASLAATMDALHKHLENDEISRNRMESKLDRILEKSN